MWPAAVSFCTSYLGASDMQTTESGWVATAAAIAIPLLSNLFGGGGGGNGQAAALAQQNAMLQQQLAQQRAAAAAKPAVPVWVWVAGGGVLLYLLLDQDR